MTKKEITIVGAGLVGSLWAVYMAKKGHKVNMYERRPDTRKEGVYGGRSINLALSDRGWKALRGVGLEDEIRKVAIPMYRRVMHSVDGTLTYQPYGKEGQAIYSVSRGGLNQTMMSLAEQHEGVKIHFDQKCTGVDLETATAWFEDDHGKIVEQEADLLFGADGFYSAVRQIMQKTDRFTYSQTYIEHGYKELSIPPAEDGGFRIEKNALHIWPRGGFMLIALPNQDGSFTCTLFMPFEGENSFENLKGDDDVLQFFRSTFPDALAMMPDLIVEWKENPTSSLGIIRCFPWTRNGKVALIGDSSHAIVPFYGQGMNAGFEDCTVLNELFEIYGDDVDTIFRQYELIRKPDADAIAELAMRNFVEMRDLTADPDFLLRKKIERRFADKYPEKWLPLYSMVTFSHIRYHDALAEGNRQDAIMSKIMSIPGIEQKWDSVEVENRLLELVS
ncbi:MAG: FAD-dependent monooxygenase [Bacteroidota bacterium]|nr:FAD-dependent monooxygenase [Bacteroidota bacterium]MDX5427520.1 FAD-dependent monooxygenase [Bacteroidota bacterium]MDX5446974.1 FAD-dependent monooxygenase [Bacteroidota bacterium]MDX5505449.1 FAD-dependent monooxygenase [Bacteroidota bacterium]